MAQKESILSSVQISFLSWIGKQPTVASNYYLTGGTPLAEFYLHHRYSEDLDFFIEAQEVNLMAVQKVIKAAKEQFNLKNVSYENFQGFHTFFLEFPNEEKLKVDFNYYPFPRIESGRKEFGIAIDSLLDIAVNKIQSIGTRTKARDFIDLYFIVKEKGLVVSDLIADARNKFDFFINPIQYGKQFLKVKEVKDFPRMIKPFDQRDLEHFFISEAEKLRGEILE